MGTIYRNGVPFVGSGGAGGVEMTQAEYDLLPTSEKMNGAIYFITDGDVSYPSASQMRYDNTESQIPSTTVQGAIDENRIEINGLNNRLNIKSGSQVFSSVAITTSYGGGSVYYGNITFTESVFDSMTEILAVTLVDYGGLGGVIMPQITGPKSLRLWSDKSQTPTSLTFKLLFR